MKPRIDLISIVTSKFSEMLLFYKDVIGFAVQLELENYVEFESEGVRFAITTNKVMEEATGHESFAEQQQGQHFELAFPVSSPSEVDARYKELIQKGATPIKEPADMPWHQRAAFLADPDGNIHEIFAKL